MHRRIFFIVFFGVVLAGAFAVFNLTRPRPQPPQPAAAVEPSAPPRAGTGAETGAPAIEAGAPIARREPAAAPATEPAPPPAPDPVSAPPATGTLSIDSDVPGAQVFIDRVFIGATPVIAPNVKPGTHRLNVSAPGYDGVVETFDVVPGPRDITIKLKDVRLDATIAVLHRHRMGSCRGQLIATPQGLRYETADKDDGFSVPLQDIEAFQVDYLAKQLKLKLPKGKQYQFSDPEGNAGSAVRVPSRRREGARTAAEGRPAGEPLAGR